ncbi:hypothetical protein [Albidovulum sp.]|uniref:hypothetical protein n=1 Tax=Albidovulum sp. TaxID=1872424 RepID=UPI001DCAADB4|nr:hypothetical protein [Paracoccaceae bacterium]MCB2117658.1 hypothetical protein [Paracoccaceae bacterium]MCB2160143.1 hypothetical protein [Paracoccaceae bacterium]MCC0046629.1 hypothetical protein [Defluviimonas sp.]HRV61997.1 hypothetical protein [Albidovulum sp.]
MASTAVVTMVYDDPEMLRIWVNYYAKFVDRRNLFVVTHGHQPYVAEAAEGCTIVPVHRRDPYGMMDVDRWHFVSEFCSSLTRMFDTVIYNDVDELLVVDPAVSDDPIAYVEQVSDEKVLTAFALEIMHRWTEEHDLDFTRPVLNQRKYVRSNFTYCKPCVVRRPVVWVPDGHGIMHQPTLNLIDHLYLFHLKWIDRQFHIERYERRFRMHEIEEDEAAVHIGAGTWIKSKAQYMRMTDAIEDTPIEKWGSGLDFADEVVMLHDLYKGSNTGRFMSGRRVGRELRVLPERFVGLF